jgi:tetratricopeptide (TPR) repeat protein
MPSSPGATRFASCAGGRRDKIAGLRHAHTAIASGTDDATTLAVAAFVIDILRQDHKAALSAIERALALNPSSATALYWGALIHASSGNSAAATAYANRALRLSPFDPVAFAAHGALGHVAFQEERYDEAASCYDKAVQANPRFSLYYFAQAIALALAGRLEEAGRLSDRGWNSIRAWTCDQCTHSQNSRGASRNFTQNGRAMKRRAAQSLNVEEVDDPQSFFSRAAFP